MIEKIDSFQELSVQQWIEVLGKKQVEIIDVLNKLSEFKGTTTYDDRTRIISFCLGITNKTKKGLIPKYSYPQAIHLSI